MLFRQRKECHSDFMATNGLTKDTSIPSAPRRLFDWLADLVGNGQSIKFLEIASAVMIVVAGVVTALLLIGQGQQSEPLAPAASATMLVGNLLPATLLLVLFGRRVALKRAENSNIGSKQLLHVRLVAIFSAITAVPTVLLVIFASLLFQSGVQFWFSGSARGMLQNAGELAKGYYDEKVRDVGAETVTMAGDIRYILSQVKIDSSEFLEIAYPQQVLNRKLSESAIVTISPNGQQNTEAVLAEKPRGNWISSEALRKLKSGENFVVTVSPNNIDAVVVLFDSPRTYLYVRRAETVPSFALGARAQSVLEDYDKMVARSRALQIQFNLALYFVSLMIIGITLWIALRVADRLVRPVNNLVDAAQRIADHWQISREDMEVFAKESHDRALRAMAEGRFQREILPYGSFAMDETARASTLEKLATLQPVDPTYPKITAAVSSSTCDAAAAILVVSEAALKKYNLTPRARIHHLSVLADDPIWHLTAPIPATAHALKKAGMKIEDIDLVEINEAFASVAMAWLKETHFPHERTNVNGGAIALGHPLGASGVKLMTTLLHELERTQKRFGLQTMCEGGGQANVTIIERL